MEANKILKCLSCDDDFPENSKGVICSNDHFFCDECTPIYIASIFNDPIVGIPARCSELNCNGTIMFENIEQYMTDDQVYDYNMYSCFKTIPQEEKKMCCPLDCGYFTIWNKDDKSNLFYCKNKECGKGTCLVCNKQFLYPKDPFNQTPEEVKQQASEDWVENHIEGCGKHMIHIKKIKEIIENGNKRFCPNCKNGARKNNGCNSITCLVCKANFCYFCGKASANCDKEVATGDVHSHFPNWKNNEARCPCWLTEINAVDNRWPKDDNGCQDFLHKILIFTELRKYATEIGSSVFTALVKRFPEISQEGCNFTELFTMDLTLLKRK